MLQWLLDRFKEKSTWQAITMFVGLFGLNLPAGTAEMAQGTAGLVVQAVLALIALVAFIRKEVK